MTPHRCGAGEPGYPPYGVVCFCIRDRDHGEADFDLPDGMTAEQATAWRNEWESQPRGKT